MADCERLPKCPFFFDKMENMPGMATILKSRYCKGDSSTCARYRVFLVLGAGNVPSDLFPNETERAERILAEEATTAEVNS